MRCDLFFKECVNFIITKEELSFVNALKEERKRKNALKIVGENVII